MLANTGRLNHSGRVAGLAEHRAVIVRVHHRDVDRRLVVQRGRAAVPCLHRQIVVFAAFMVNFTSDRDEAGGWVNDKLVVLVAVHDGVADLGVDAGVQ